MSESGSEDGLLLNRDSLSKFFSRFDEFDKKRDAQKSKGENDYNLLRSVFKRISDEVDLHSRFLHSMLNPAGPHFRGKAFGEAFMSVLGHSDWLDWATTRAYREHKCIDLYLTDGKRHVLIENKIHAVDQPAQVKRYIDEIRNISYPEHIPADDLLFVYLSNGRNGPTKESLESYQLRATPFGTYVVDGAGQPVARFVNAHYRSHVLPWIAQCLESVKHIDNLRYAFSEYQNVVQRITRTYKSRVMSLEDFLLETSPELDSRSRVRFAFEIVKQMPTIKANWLARMFIEGLDNLLDEEVRDGRLALIEKDDSQALEPMQFDSRDARSFFEGGGARDKGRFWRVASGMARDDIALAVLFGTSYLHVGLLPTPRSTPAHAMLNEFNLKIDGQGFEFRRHRAINGKFEGLVSWAVLLDAEIELLATFEESRVARIVKALVKHALESNALSRPETVVANEGLSQE